MSELKDRLKVLVEKIKLPPADVARRAKVPESSISRAIDGTRSLTPDTLLKILGAFPKAFSETEKDEIIMLAMAQVSKGRGRIWAKEAAEKLKNVGKPATIGPVMRYAGHWRAWACA